jgi:multidrug efflux pump subunit AcrA (membrane-fusion protein)
MRPPEIAVRGAWAAVLLALVAACGAPGTPAPVYETAVVTRGDLAVTVEASGVIEPVKGHAPRKETP